MARKLKTSVHVVERDDKGNVTNSGTFGPDDDLSTKENSWVEKVITNPDVWADGSDDDPDPADSDAQLIQAPNGGEGLEGSTQLNYDGMDLNGLRSELKSRDLSTSGNKPELVSRLRDSDRDRLNK